ncbi:MAG: hypothetical protein GX079_01910 [Tissierellia bacterium]|nr:hypothetical protein [Tissierellia bacterium]
MVIIYDGNNLVKLVAELKQDGLAVLTSQAEPRPEEAIYYMEKGQSPDLIKDLPTSWKIEIEDFNVELLDRYRDRVFTKDFVTPRPLGSLYVQGSTRGIFSLCTFLLSATRISFGISGDSYRCTMLKEMGQGRIRDYEGQPLHLILGQAGDLERQLIIWDGSKEELYELRQNYEELPRHHYLVQRGFGARSFHSQRIIHGRYLGRISKKGFNFEWRKILSLLEE